MGMEVISKWKKYTSKKLFDEIMAFAPKDVTVTVDNKVYITASINTEKEYGEGIAICSIEDENYYYDLKKGINTALGRAVKALKNKESDLPVRDDFSEFPNTWTKRSIDRVMTFAGYYKSYYENYGDNACAC